MTVEERVHLCRLIEKMARNPRGCEAPVTIISSVLGPDDINSCKHDTLKGGRHNGIIQKNQK